MPFLARGGWACVLLLLVLQGASVRAQLDTAAAAALWRDTLFYARPLQLTAVGGATLVLVPDSTVPLITLGLSWPAPVAYGRLHTQLLARPVLPPYLPTEADERLRSLGAEFNTAYSLGHSTAVLTLPRARLAEGLRLLRSWWLSERFDTFYVGLAKADVARQLQTQQQTPRQQLNRLVGAGVTGTATVDPYASIRALRLQDLRLFHRGLGRRTRLVTLGGDIDANLTAEVLQYLSDSLGIRPTAEADTLPAEGSGSRPLRDSLFLFENALATQPLLQLGYRIRTGSEAESISAQLLAELLNLPATRWHRALVRADVARNLSASLDPLDSLSSLLRITIEPNRPTANGLEACLLTAEGELASLIDLTYWRPREVQAAQQRLEADYEFSREPTSRFCRQLPLWWAEGKLDLAARYPEALRRTDGFALSEWAGRELVDQPSVGGLLVPSGFVGMQALADLLERRNHPERAAQRAAAEARRLQALADSAATLQAALRVAEASPDSASDSAAAEVAERVETPVAEAVWSDSLAPLTVRFALGKTRLDSTARAQVQQVAALLKRHPKLRLYVDGHTDRVGSAAFNTQLAQQRAALVRNTLITRHKVAAARLRLRSFGERRPQADEGTAEGRAQNRRVEFVIR